MAILLDSWSPSGAYWARRLVGLIWLGRSSDLVASPTAGVAPGELERPTKAWNPSHRLFYKWPWPFWAIAAGGRVALTYEKRNLLQH